MTIKLLVAVKGGSGSGNWGHTGRPGLVGGSGGGAGIVGQPGLASGGNKGKAGRFLSEVVTETSGAPEAVGLRAKWALASGYDRRNTKYIIVEDLAERSGVDENIISKIITSWAGTSNDTDMEALSLQEAAAEELGLKLSAWQQEVIAYTREEGTTRPITSRVNERAVMRAMYDHTQEQLARRGLKPGDYIQLARGVGHYMEAPTWKEGDVINYKGNAMESWSVATAVATGFATMETDADYGTVLTMAVPVSSIIGTARTGFGCLTQGEFVIAGNIPGSKATVQMTTY